MDRIPFDPYDFFGYLASGLLVIVGMELVLGFPHILGKELKLVDSALLLLAVYIAGQIVGTPAKSFLEDFVIDKLLKRPSINLFRAKKPIIRGILFPGFYKAFPQAIQARILERSNQESFGTPGEALFLHVRYSPQTLDNEKLMKKLDSFISKYGFSRNLAFTAFVVGGGLFWKGHFNSDRQLTVYGFTSLIASILLFYRYLKFFRQYSYELFNVYAGRK